jgi:hypothetical protein
VSYKNAVTHVVFNVVELRLDIMHSILIDACGMHERGEKSLQGFGGKRAFRRPRHRWEDGNRIDLREIGWGVWSRFCWLRIGGGLS